MTCNAILFIMGGFYPDLSGGPSITVYWIARSLHAKNVQVKVLTTDRGIPEEIGRNKWLNTNYGVVQYVQTLKNSIPVLLFFKSLFELRRADNIYMTSFFYPLSFLIAPVGILMGKKVIWAPRGETSPDALKYGKFKKRIILALIRFFRKQIIFHATSPAEKCDIQRVLGGCRIEVIPVGMEILPQLITQKQPTDLLFLGRIHPIKGIDRLLEALTVSKYFLQSHHRLIIAGYPQKGYDAVLKKMIEDFHLTDKVVFKGRVEGIEKETIIAESYLLVLPSHSENFGAVVAESLAQGTPCIASHGTPWSILEDYKAGYWVENTPEALATAIDKMIVMDLTRYNETRQNARRLAIQEIDIERQVSKWQALLTEQQ